MQDYTLMLSSLSIFERCIWPLQTTRPHGRRPSTDQWRYNDRLLTAIHCHVRFRVVFPKKNQSHQCCTPRRSHCHYTVGRGDQLELSSGEGRNFRVYSMLRLGYVLLSFHSTLAIGRNEADSFVFVIRCL